MRAGGIFLAIAAICKEGTDGVDKKAADRGKEDRKPCRPEGPIEGGGPSRSL